MIDVADGVVDERFVDGGGRKKRRTFAVEVRGSYSAICTTKCTE